MEAFNAAFERDSGWWVAYLEELPSANTQGRPLEEARENLKEAAGLIIDPNREIARPETASVTIQRAPSRIARHFGAAKRAARTLDWRAEREAFEEGIAEEVASEGR